MPRCTLETARWEEVHDCDENCIKEEPPFYVHAGVAFRHTPRLPFNECGIPHIVCKAVVFKSSVSVEFQELIAYCLAAPATPDMGHLASSTSETLAPVNSHYAR